MILDLLTGFEKDLNDSKSAAKVELEQAVEVFAMLKHKNIIRVFQKVMQNRGFEIPASEFEKILKLKHLPPIEIASELSYLPIKREVRTAEFRLEIPKRDLLNQKSKDVLNMNLNKAYKTLLNYFIDNKSIDLDFIDRGYDFIEVKGRLKHLPPLDSEIKNQDKKLNELLNGI
jgi:hypothetical protein